MLKFTDEIVVDFNHAVQRQDFLEKLARSRGLLRFRISPYRPPRSNQQLKYYWPYVVRPFADWRHDENGEPHSLQASHRVFKEMFLTVDVIDELTGEVVGQRVRSTGELDTREFAIFVEACRNHLAAYCHVDTPEPTIPGLSGPAEDDVGSAEPPDAGRRSTRR